MTADDLRAFEQQIIEHEGLRLKAYTDTRGKVTIGVGRNLTDVGLSLPEVMDLLEHDIAAVTGAVLHALPWVGTLDLVRQRVLLDMAFNLGVGGLLGFPRMLAAIQAKDYDEAADQMLASAWANQVKGRALRLARMMRTGQPPQQVAGTVYPPVVKS